MEFFLNRFAQGQLVLVRNEASLRRQTEIVPLSRRFPLSSTSAQLRYPMSTTLTSTISLPKHDTPSSSIMLPSNDSDGSSRMVRFDNQCTLIPDSSKRPKGLSKSYSLPLWKKRPSHTSDYETEVASTSSRVSPSTEETHIVFKVPIPRCGPFEVASRTLKPYRSS